jgi:S1-C subfamily serine protease
VVVKKIKKIMPKNTFLKIIILATIFGLGSGVVGQLLAAAYLSPGDVFILGNDGRIKNVEIQNEENKKITEAHRLVSPTVFEIYSQKTQTRDPVNQIFLEKDRVALGFALTSDGWLLSFGRTLADPKNHFVVITSDQKIFSPEKILFDETSEAVFLKINAENLSVPPLGEIENLALGEKIVIPKNKQTLNLAVVLNSSYEKISEPKDLLRSSEKLTKSIAVNGAWLSNEAGAPAVNLAGEVVGITTPLAGIISPIASWRSAILSVLKNGEVVRPNLGIHYFNLSKAPGLDVAVSQNQKTGALIWSDKNLQITGVTKNGAAAKAGLKDGDIILKINSEEISSKKDLAEIIEDYAPGEKIELTILRLGEEKIIEVTLN